MKDDRSRPETGRASGESDRKKPAHTGNGGNWSDLGPRVLSALLLAIVVLFATYSGPLPFAALVTIGGLVLSWEWGRIVRDAEFDELMVQHALSVAAAGGLAFYGQYMVALLVLLLGPSVKYALADDRQASKLGISLIGIPYIGLPVISLIWLRSDPNYGWLAIFYLFVVVWAVDIFAYFVGRTFGGPKLAPIISPVKTWSGFFGGIGAGALAGGLFALVLGGTSPLKLMLVSLLIALFCQLGDLLESALKRRFHVKDSSHLIPGHGGVFDRVDALMVAALAATLIALVAGDAEPGRSLLIWNA